MEFVPAYVIQVRDAFLDTGFRYITAERYIPGAYTKFNGNDGYVSATAEAQVMDVVAAFSHFSFEHTGGEELCVDVQGVGCRWTDPQLHSRSRCYGPADLGAEGMRLFFLSHRCSVLCRALGLRPAACDDAPAAAPRDCVVCLSAPRAVACRPCGHLCLCRGCGGGGGAPLPGLERCPLCREPLAAVTGVDLAVHGQHPSTFLRDL